MKPFPRGRNVLEPLQQEARQGVMVIGLGQIEIELSVELEDLQISGHQPGTGIVLLFEQIRFVGLTGILITNDFSSEIRCGHQTLGAAVLIHHQQKRLTAADHRQQLRQRACF